MYNKIFTKILDSSIWLEPDHTRLIWLTLIASMDRDGFAQYASVANLAHRARVPLEAAQAAVESLEGPDPDSSDPENEGRRIERIPGGWVILNAEKYRELVTTVVQREQTKLRVQRHRERKRNKDGVTDPLHGVTSNTPSVSVSASVVDRTSKKENVVGPRDSWLRELQQRYPASRVSHGYATETAFNQQFTGERPDSDVWADMLAGLESQLAGHEWRVKGMVPRLDKWLREGLWRQRHDANPPAAERVTAKTNRTLEAAARVVREAKP